ncbi:alpha-l-rhamnosidase a protein [Rutstroemia sp. NJR-2017a BVV2]|nr:alpha-l-rhamnosidase a protein [Rutstroemia sp. NJR-2017a BVV2]
MPNMCLLSWCTLYVLICLVLARYEGPDYANLPSDTLFPGSWEKYIRAPVNKSSITPARIYRQEGDFVEVAGDHGKKTLVIRAGGLFTLEFAENIVGRLVLVLLIYTKGSPSLVLACSESPAFVDRLPDATTDRQERDLPLTLPITRNGVTCVGNDFLRGGFKYLTVYIVEQDRVWSAISQKILGIIETKPKPAVSISSIWVNCTAFPSKSNGRAYTGYFSSSSPLLNRIWYSGAWTLHYRPLIPARATHSSTRTDNKSPPGSWYSNFTIANGTTVTTDGAKRDRVVWPGDMSIAVPGIAVSTYDMLAVRNALDTLFDHQYADGSLPYAGPPISSGAFSDTYHLHTLLGVYNYVLYSGNLEWLKMRWPAYLKALKVSMVKVADWLRPGMTGHNLEASVLLNTVLKNTYECASWIDGSTEAQRKEWSSLQLRLTNGIETLWCHIDGLFADNIGRRSCNGSEKVLPQDGNSLVLISGLFSPKTRLQISHNLRKRWGKYGAPAPEFSNTISPFATSFELFGHCAVDSHDAAVELMQLQWGYMLDGPGFTNSTLVEGYRVDGHIQYPAYWSAARNSHAHGWSSGLTSVLMQGILGIQLLSPLGRNWRIEPHRTKWLQFVRGGFATKLGRFEVSVAVMEERGTGREIEVLSFVTPRGSSGRGMGGGFPGGEYRGFRWVGERTGTKGWNVWEEGMEERFVVDENWVELEMEEREAGVVDWDALSRNYVDGPGSDGESIVPIGFRAHVEMLELEKARAE